MPPTLIVIGGCNGAGKTTFARHYLPAAGITRFLNADEIARGLSPLAPAQSAVRAGRLLLTEMKALLDRRASFALESTLSGKTYLRLLAQARELGYKTVVHYLLLSSALQAMHRVATRVRNGGHFVPEQDITRRFHRSRQHLMETTSRLRMSGRCGIIPNHRPCWLPSRLTPRTRNLQHFWKGCVSWKSTRKIFPKIPASPSKPTAAPLRK